MGRYSFLLTSQFEPCVAGGAGEQMFVVYSGYADSVNGRPAKTMRIWGTTQSFTGLQEREVESSTGQRGLRIAPNPFCRTTEIVFDIGQRNTLDKCGIRIYDIAGSLVKAFDDLSTSRIMWCGNDDAGRDVASGLYVCRLNVGEEVLSEKIIFLK